MKKITITALFVIFAYSGFVANSRAQTVSREDLLNEIKAKRSELQALERQFLAPSEEDRAEWTEFLKESHTGLIRLLPRELYDSEVYKKNQRTLTMRGGGAYYSFSRLTHEYGYGSDIELDSGYLSVGFAGADFGMLRKLGDVPLEALSLEDPRAKFMAEYHTPTEEPQARSEARMFSAGATIGDTIYKRRLPVEVKTTYLLRSINYGSSDVLVALRVIRKDSDGSVIIAWKLLSSYPKPELARSN